MLERIYCDESGQDGKNRYMLIGGLWVPHEKRIELNQEFINFRNEFQMNNELKWTRVSNNKLTEYKRFIDIFFNVTDIRYNCILVDKHQLNYRKFHNNDKELGFYKFYYQLLSRKMESNKSYKVFLDRKKNRNPNRLIT